MAKVLHDLDFVADGNRLTVNGEDWGDVGLTLQQMFRLKQMSEKRGGFEFVISDRLIPENVWTDRRNLFSWQVVPEFMQKVLYTHNWRGGCFSPGNVLKLSSLYGTDMAYLTDWPKDLGENTLLVSMLPDNTVRIFFEFDLR
ncbi:hypothetical protein pEaSNUABM29_00197 [Erwinia phage pEa_SNUABM_29]|nr:hypothetical protein pEaSNUABM29_00197 [Erwinia phage pEa_SNUABM_29]